MPNLFERNEVDNSLNKTFLHIEDNGDGTCTSTLKISQIDLFETTIITMNFQEFLSSIFGTMSPEVLEYLQDLASENTVTIPHSPE